MWPPHRALRTLSGLDLGVAEVLGSTRYRSVGDLDGGTAHIQVMDRRGIAQGLRSRTADNPLLRGTKHLVAMEQQCLVAKGRSGERTALLVPEVERNRTVGMLLSHVRLLPQLDKASLRSMLGSNRNRFAALADAVTETEPSFDEDLLATVPVVDLLCEPVYSLADRFRQGHCSPDGAPPPQHAPFDCTQTTARITILTSEVPCWTYGELPQQRRQCGLPNAQRCRRERHPKTAAHRLLGPVLQFTNQLGLEDPHAACAAPLCILERTDLASNLHLDSAFFERLLRGSPFGRVARINHPLWNTELAGSGRRDQQQLPCVVLAPQHKCARLTKQERWSRLCHDLDSGRRKNSLKEKTHTIHSSRSSPAVILTSRLARTIASASSGSIPKVRAKCAATTTGERLRPA